MRMFPIYKAHGTTLIELILSIVIIAFGLSGILMTLIFVSGKSADPLIEQQALAIADTYMEEILSKSYPTIGPPCPAPVSTRALFTSICDYDSLSESGIEDQFGDPVSELDDYHISVEVLFIDSDRVRVDVKVAHPNLGSREFSAYRYNY